MTDRVLRRMLAILWIIFIAIGLYFGRDEGYAIKASVIVLALPVAAAVTFAVDSVFLWNRYR